MKPKTSPTFFKNSEEFRAWLEQNHETAEEIWVGYYKKETGIASMTWQESVDQALCFGWIDGIRKKVDEISYMNRFTPRKPGSNWSSINIRKIKELIDKGLVALAGKKAFEKRTDNNAYNERPEELPGVYEALLQKNKKAWDFFSALAPSYRKASVWYIISAKQETTRLKRLQELIDASAEGLKIKQLQK